MNSAYNAPQIDPIFTRIFLQINPSLSALTLKNYLSDLRHFMGWYGTIGTLSSADSTLPTAYSEVENAFAHKTISQYEEEMHRAGLALNTIKRRLASIRLVQAYLLSQTKQQLNPNATSKDLRHQSQTLTDQAQVLRTQARESIQIPSNQKRGIFRQQNSQKVNFFKSHSFFGLMGLAFFASLLAFGLPVWSKNTPRHAYQAATLAANFSPPVPIAKPILFQGLIKDKVGNPILNMKKFQFKIYSKQTGGVPIYESGVCELKPTIYGQIRTYIGVGNIAKGARACGTPIPQNLIVSNTPLYLGVTVGADAEMTPRQPLANSALSTNALMIDGYGIGSGANSIPVIQNDGSITLSDPASKIVSTNPEGTFTIGGASALLLTSGSYKDIEFEATQSGNIRFRAGSLGADQMVIARNGNIGINTNTPDQFRLEISGSIGPSVRGSYNLGSSNRSWDTVYTNKICFTSDSYCIDKNSVTGLAIETADVAEIYPVEAGGEVGDVVALGPNLIKTTSGDRIRSLVKATSSMNQYLVGVIANNHDRRIIVGQNISSADNPLPIALKGRIPVKIAPNSPAIHAGDYLSSSDVAGLATKATKNGIMIGRAIDDWLPNTGQQTVMTYIETSYAQLTTSPLADVARQIQTLDIFPHSVETQKIISPIIETDKLTARTITTNSLQADKLTAHEATISGTLTADTVEAKNISDLAARIAEAVKKTGELASSTTSQTQTTADNAAKINEIQKSLNEIATSSPSIPPPQNGTDNSQLLGPVASANLLVSNLTATETTNLFDVNIGGTIRALTDTLNLSALSSISFMDKAVTIAKNGDIVTQGLLRAEKGVQTNEISSLSDTDNVSVNLGVQGALFVKQGANRVSASISSQGKASFDSLSLSSESTPSAILASSDNLRQNGLFAPGIESEESSVGVGSIPSGEREVVVYTNKLTQGAKVFLTPLSSDGPIPTLAATNTCSDQDALGCKSYFIVQTASDVTNDTSFNWLVIQAK